MEKLIHIAKIIILYPWKLSEIANDLSDTYKPIDQSKTIEDSLNRALDVYARDFDYMNKEEKHSALATHIISQLQLK